MCCRVSSARRPAERLAVAPGPQESEPCTLLLIRLARDLAGVPVPVLAAQQSPGPGGDAGGQPQCPGLAAPAASEGPMAAFSLARKDAVFCGSIPPEAQNAAPG